MYKFYLSKVPSGCKRVPLFYVQYATGMRILYCLYKVQPFLTLCAISKLRAHENLDTPEHMTNCKAHGRNSHLYHLLYLDAGWHFLSNKECHLWLNSSPSFQIFITKFPPKKKVPTNRVVVLHLMSLFRPCSSDSSLPFKRHVRHNLGLDVSCPAGVQGLWVQTCKVPNVRSPFFVLAHFKTPEWNVSISFNTKSCLQNSRAPLSPNPSKLPLSAWKILQKNPFSTPRFCCKR